MKIDKEFNHSDGLRLSELIPGEVYRRIGREVAGLGGALFYIAVREAGMEKTSSVVRLVDGARFYAVADNTTFGFRFEKVPNATMVQK